MNAVPPALGLDGPAEFPVPWVADPPALGFTAFERPVVGAGEFNVPLLPAVVPAPPVPEYAPVLSAAVPVPGPGEPAVPVAAPAVPVLIGAPALPPTDPVEPAEPPEDCATATTDQSAAAPASTPVPTHRHAVRFMTLASREKLGPTRRPGDPHRLQPTLARPC